MGYLQTLSPEEQKFLFSIAVAAAPAFDRSRGVFQGVPSIFIQTRFRLLTHQIALLKNSLIDSLFSLPVAAPVLY